MPPSRTHRLLLVLILLAAGLLRVTLCSEGGQYFFGDELRYDRGLHLFRALTRGDIATVKAFAALPEHSLFIGVATGVSAAHRAISVFTPYSDWSKPENLAASIWIAAALLSLFSTLNLWLVYRLARAVGAPPAEALWALALMAASNTAFYYSRHLLPYDCALSAALAALLVAVSGPTRTLTRAAWCGGLAGVCYGLYNGYWYLVPTLCIAHTMLCWREPLRARLRLAVACAAGCAFTLALPLIVGTAIEGAAFWHDLLGFSGTVKQGVFAEGWSLPWEFFWHAEGLPGLAVVLLVGAALLRDRGATPTRVVVTLLILAVGYGLLVLAANGLARFVVYGRTVKPFVPAFCLLGGWALHRLVADRRVLVVAAAGALVVGAFHHFAPHFPRVFPREFKIATFAVYGTPKVTVTFSGSMVPAPPPVSRPDLVLVNALLLYPLRAPYPLPAGTTVLRAEHPLSYLPYQYEGFSPRERALLRNHDTAMRLIKLADPAAVPEVPPAAVLFGPQDFPDGRR